MEYKEDEFLMLSGIQHFAFCRRQWGLIHIEQQWAENFRTTDGMLMHERAHNSGQNESRGSVKIIRSMSIHSYSLGVSGQCDVVEFHRDNAKGIEMPGWEGAWVVYPIEYKRGKPKENLADELQLCAQAICLEEMLCCKVERGALFYGETRRRKQVDFSESLRSQVRSITEEMHELYKRKHTPKVKPGKGCSACSLKDLCLPTLIKKSSAVEYMYKSLEDCQ
ncbi:MAG: CRISPR-associated protein Cas4 [Monoglobaceae bacterium]